MLNSINIQGRLTRDPELRRTQSETSVALFSIAVDRVKRENGADFFSVVAWRNTAEFVCRNFHKGDMIIIDGKLSSREWTDNDGNKRKAIEIVADEVHFGGSKKTESNPERSPASFDSFDNAPGGSAFSELSDCDGELPF